MATKVVITQLWRIYESHNYIRKRIFTRHYGGVFEETRLFRTGESSVAVHESITLRLLLLVT